MNHTIENYRIFPTISLLSEEDRRWHEIKIKKKSVVEEICLVCGTRLGKQLICKQCGYDRTKEYEYHLTLGIVPKDSTSVVKRNHDYRKKMIQDQVTPLQARIDELLKEIENLKKAQEVLNTVTLNNPDEEEGPTDPVEQNRLGDDYYYGRGVEKDYKEAVKWYRKSAENGNASGQHNLGLCYQYSYGVEEDKKEAVKWYRKSAENGNASGQNSLGWCYQYSYGVEEDKKEAVKWYRKSAENGNSSGQYNLGVCYHTGRGVDQDYKEAVKWYRKSAEQGNANAQCNLGWCYDTGYGVEQDKKEAAKWYKLAADQGNEIALNNLKLLNK